MRRLLSLVLLLVAPVAAALNYPAEREISPRRSAPANVGRFPLTAMAQLVEGHGNFDRSDPLLVAEMPAMRRGSSAVVLPGSVGRLLCTRGSAEPELSSVSRVFLRTAPPPRVRAVHH